MFRRSSSSTPALIVAILALVVAVAGTATAHPGLAAKALTKARVIKIVNKQISHRAKTLTVQNARRLNGTPASTFFIANDLAADSTFTSSCDPTSTTFVTCLTLQIKLDRPSKLLLTAQTPFGDDTNNGATGICDIQVDGLLEPGTGIRVGIGGTGGASSDNDNTGMGVTHVTASLPVGVHTMTLECNELTADIDFNDMSLSAVGIPVG